MSASRALRRGATLRPNSLLVLLALILSCRGYIPSVDQEDVSTPADTDSDRSDGGDSDPNFGNDTDSFDTARSCAVIDGTSLTGGPADLYGFCWYVGAPAQTCDDACSEVGGENLAFAAEGAFPDSKDYPGTDGVATWFYEHGNPGPWYYGGWTELHALGFGYPYGGFGGKCANCTAPSGAYPGEEAAASYPYLMIQLVCACFESDAR